MPTSEPQSSSRNDCDFSQKVRAHQASLFGYLSRLGLSGGLVEDVAQEAFLRAWRYRDRYDASHSQWNTWLFRIARNVAFSTMKKNAKLPQATDPVVLEETSSHTDDPSANTEREQKRLQLKRAIQQLNHDERDVLALAYVDGLSSTEAAIILECEPGTYRTRVSRARTRLTHLLEIPE